MSSQRRLFLVRHAPTAAVRAAAFGADEPLDADGLALACAVTLPPAGSVLVSPAARTAQTAAAAGHASFAVEPALAEGSFGRWAGRSLEEVHAAEPEAVAAWMRDAAAAPHGGESLDDVLARVGSWLRAQAALDGSALCVTHGGVVKAAVVHALGAGAAAFWRIDVAPLSLTELVAHDGVWTVARVNERLVGAAARRREQAAGATSDPADAERSDATTGPAEAERSGATSDPADAKQSDATSGTADAKRSDATTGAAGRSAATSAPAPEAVRA